jgi:nucleolar protein 56
MKSTAPNVSALVGEIIGSKLITRAGGLEKLAKLPASTVQVLGAGKNFFRYY